MARSTALAVSACDNVTWISCPASFAWARSAPRDESGRRRTTRSSRWSGTAPARRTNAGVIRTVCRKVPEGGRISAGLSCTPTTRTRCGARHFSGASSQRAPANRRMRISLPGWSPSRLAVSCDKTTSSAALGFAGRPATNRLRLIVVPYRPDASYAASTTPGSESHGSSGLGWIDRPSIVSSNAGNLVTVVASATAGRPATSARQSAAASGRADASGHRTRTPTSNACCALRNRSWALPVRRDPANSMSDAPPTAPTSIESANHARQRLRSSLRKR